MRRVHYGSYGPRMPDCAVMRKTFAWNRMFTTDPRLVTCRTCLSLVPIPIAPRCLGCGRELVRVPSLLDANGILMCPLMADGEPCTV